MDRIYKIGGHCFALPDERLMEAVDGISSGRIPLGECRLQKGICVMPAAGPWPVSCAGRAAFSAADAGTKRSSISRN